MLVWVFESTWVRFCFMCPWNRFYSSDLHWLPPRLLWWAMTSGLGQFLNRTKRHCQQKRPSRFQMTTPLLLGFSGFSHDDSVAVLAAVFGVRQSCFYYVVNEHREKFKRIVLQRQWLMALRKQFGLACLGPAPCGSLHWQAADDPGSDIPFGADLQDRR